MYWVFDNSRGGIATQNRNHCLYSTHPRSFTTTLEIETGTTVWRVFPQLSPVLPQEGPTLSLTLGCELGTAEGAPDTLGLKLGCELGTLEGALDESTLGLTLGCELGTAEGAPDALGLKLGCELGSTETVKYMLGIAPMLASLSVAWT
jgi:hypothetical protein